MSVSADSYGLHPDRLYACTLSRFRSFMLYVAAKRGYFPVLFLHRKRFIFDCGMSFPYASSDHVCQLSAVFDPCFLCVKKRKFRFLPLCMLLICLHSFYFAIAAFAAIGWYWLRTEKRHFGKIRFSKNISLPPFFPYAWRRRSFCRQDLY